MNKKFFAALASATMAFTASGSIAVFADDFVEERNDVLDGNDVKPIETEVKWNKENFGALVTGNADFAGVLKDVKEGDTIKTSLLEDVKSITLKDGFKGEVKGLEYFTNLETFTAENGTLKNKTLDFSENTKLYALTVTNAEGLTGLTLPKAYLNEDEEEVYSLNTLNLQNTALTSLDFSAQDALDQVSVYNNGNLKEVVVAKGTKAHPHVYSYFNVSLNGLETLDLENCKFTGTLAFNSNRIGVIDLSATTIDTDQYYAQDQKLYVSETLATINVKDTFDNIDTHDFSANGYNKKTGVLDLDKADAYTYTTTDKAGKTRELGVNIQKANPMNRLYNPNSGEHFYTADIKEKEALVALGWNDEAYGWVAPATPETKEAKKQQAVYRLYNPNAGDHHYTMNENEVKTLVSYGWKDEGTGWYSATADTVTVWRQYNPYANGAGSHNYTTDRAENDHLVSLGWVYEGAAWKALR